MNSDRCAEASPDESSRDIVFQSHGVPPESLDDLEARISELGAKSNQVLLFLSFLILAAVTLKNRSFPPQLNLALAAWKFALFPMLAGIAPLKEFRPKSYRWYNAVRYFKTTLLWISILLIAFGVAEFLSV
jgi:hypothetical protein